MSDDNDCDLEIAVGEVVNGLLNFRFVLSVESGCGLVEDEKDGAFDECSGEGDSLLFTAGELASGCADVGVDAVAQAPDEFEGVGFLECFLKLFCCGVWLAVAHVFSDGFVE